MPQWEKETKPPCNSCKFIFFTITHLTHKISFITGALFYLSSLDIDLKATVYFETNLVSSPPPTEVTSVEEVESAECKF